jgi:hypothetical protein
MDALKVAEHTPERWEIRTPKTRPGFIPLVHIRGGVRGFFNIATLQSGDSRVNDLANARRIVACVNACAGIPTELLESLELGELDAAINDGSRDPSHPMLGR